jgi:hypothetical protein
MQADPNFSLDSSDGVYIVFLCIVIINLDDNQVSWFNHNINQIIG